MPSQEDWAIQCDYQIQLQEIKNLKTIEIPKTDIDLAKMQNRSIEDLKEERLRSEKERLISELNKKFGIKGEEKKPDIIPENSENRMKIRQDKLWDLLDGKGLIVKTKQDANNGLQDKI
jgi:hypothetical protein